MSNNDEFKSLWSKQTAPEKPDINLIVRKAVSYKVKARNKWLSAVILCFMTGLFIIYIAMNIDARLITTRIGIIVTLTGIFSFVVTMAGIIKPLYKAEEQSSNSDFLDQMLRLKKGQDFIHRKFMNVYFFLISTGVLLYMYEFALRMTLFWGIVCYAVTIGWMAFNWLYLKPRTTRKQAERLNNTIRDLEEINRQVKD